MIDWLYTFPDWVLLAFWAAILAGVMVALPFLTQRLPWLRPSPDNSDFVLRLQATLFTITSFVVAFTLVQAEFNFRKVDALVSAEASHINRLDRLLLRYGSGVGDDARPLLLAYARSVVADEWPGLVTTGDRSDKTQQAFRSFSRSILVIEPALGRQTNIHAEILRSFDAIAEARDARLNAVTVSLSATFWQAILFAVVILLFVSSAVERTRFRSIIMGCQMAVLGAFIGFVFIMDQPFKGHSAVDPQAITQAIALIEARKAD